MNNRVEIPPIITSEPYLGCSVVALSDVGCVREENQDFMGYVKLPDAQVLIVADGMGGHSGGFEASRIVVSAIKQICSQAVDQPPASILQQSLHHAHELVRKAGASDPMLDGMGSTAVVAYVRGRELWLAHVGDSRAYLIRDGHSQQLTTDHTRVNRMVAEGMISPEDAQDHPMGHILERSLGATEHIEPEVQPSPIALLPGDRIMLCSDGFTGRITNSEIAGLLSPAELEPTVRAALQLALVRQADDNTTIGVIEVTGGRPRRRPPPAGAGNNSRSRRDIIYPLIIVALIGIIVLLSGALLYSFQDEVLAALGLKSTEPVTPPETSGDGPPPAEEDMLSPDEVRDAGSGASGTKPPAGAAPARPSSTTTPNNDAPPAGAAPETHSDGKPKTRPKPAGAKAPAPTTPAASPATPAEQSAPSGGTAPAAGGEAGASSAPSEAPEAEKK